MFAPATVSIIAFRDQGVTVCAGFIQKFVSQVLLTFEFQANVPGSALCERTAFSVERRKTENY